jgi:thioredoxin reductase
MIFDSLVVGGGFAGLSAAIHLARARRSVCVVDAGQPRNRFSQASHGFFGHDGARPREMIGQAKAQIGLYPTVTQIYGTVTAAQRSADSEFSLNLASGETLAARTLVLAFGVADAVPDLPGFVELWGTGVLHCPYCHGYEQHRGPLGVLDVRRPYSARQAALLADWGPITFFLNGRNDLDQETRGLLARRGVTLEPAPVARLVGAAPGPIGVELVDGRTLEVKAVFVQPQTSLNSDIAEQLGCAIDEEASGPVIRTDAVKRTTVNGVFAAGDIARASHNATWASSDGVTAGISAHQFLVFG